MKVTSDSEANTPARFFHLSAGGAHKFWSVRVEGAVQTVRFGRIGTDGQTCVKTLASPAEAARATEQIIGQKVKKGYQEVSPAEAARATPRRPEFCREQLALPF